MPTELTSRPMGLIARLENSRIALPLKRLDINADITGNLVSVELEQLFLLDCKEPLNCTYTFPLPADAAVYRCEMHVSDRVIEAKVLSREKARRVFNEKQKQGQRAALAEMDRENLFNLNLGNLQPGDLIRVRFAYIQQLDRLDDLCSLRVPLTPGVRYVPGKPLNRANQSTGRADDTDQVPDASRVSPPRIDALHPNAASFHANVRIDEARDQLVALRSPSHSIDIREDSQATVVAIAGDEQIPDRDFVVEWGTAPAKSTSARAWITNRGKSSFALLELNGGPLPPEVMPESRDIYVLLDRSGSMNGAPWKAACRAVHSFAKSLPESTRFDLTLFESQFTHFTQKPISASTFLQQAGSHASVLVALGVSGGTELAPALDAVFARRNKFSAGKPAVVLLITDGMVANERALLDHARNSNTCLHLVGIGFAPNDSLRSVAATTGGQAVFSPPNEDIEKVVTRFSSRLSSPLFDHLHPPFGWEFANEENIGGLYPLDQQSLVLRGDSGASLSTLKAERDGEKTAISVETLDVENTAVSLLWARDRIRSLESDGLENEALALSLEFNLPSRQTSFVAWDREKQVSVADRHLHQPSLDLMADAFFEGDAFMGNALLGSEGFNSIPDMVRGRGGRSRRGRGRRSRFDVSQRHSQNFFMEPEPEIWGKRAKRRGLFRRLFGWFAKLFGRIRGLIAHK